MRLKPTPTSCKELVTSLCPRVTTTESYQSRRLQTVVFRTNTGSVSTGTRTPTMRHLQPCLCTLMTVQKNYFTHFSCLLFAIIVEMCSYYQHPSTYPLSLSSLGERGNTWYQIYKLFTYNDFTLLLTLFRWRQIDARTRDVTRMHQEESLWLKSLHYYDDQAMA